MNARLITASLLVAGLLPAAVANVQTPAAAASLRPAGRKSGKWTKNGEAIADFLSKANPNWPRATLVEMMNMHLSTTTHEVVARLTKNWDADVRAYDAVYAHILMMADALSSGIIEQFPARFARR